MLINLKVKTLDARTHDFSIDNEITIRQFKDQIAEKTNIAAENQRIIYQGRVLADDKLVKEYDVDGKVLHIAERPPFSQRGANATNNDEPRLGGFRNMPGRPTTRNLRNAPYFRALDGMLVGTMALPVNNGPLAGAGPMQNNTAPTRFTNSSSFCVNRITVAQHMIDCAENIAAYLENPEIGLNNQPLDILQRGHWTIESTVVEVGVSPADMPRNNNIMDMVQDAVTAALSRSTPGRNYTVLQLPTVFTNEGGEGQQPSQMTSRDGNEDSNEGAAGGAMASSDTSEEPTAAAAVIIEDVIETDDEAADGDTTPRADDERSTSPPTGAAAAASGSASSTADAAAAAGGETGSNAANDASNAQRRTRTQVLASVVRRIRTVETRLSPFLDRYIDILETDPSFEEGQTEQRENAQRTFDRVSEAMHYLSHAQHAISDLMLDLSQPGPRVLTCRPILVEQSGYIRSNNIFTPNIVAGQLSDIIAQVPQAMPAARGAATAAAPTSGEASQPPQNAQPTNAQPAAATGAAADQQPNEDAMSDDSMAAGVAQAVAAAAVVAGLMPRNNEQVEDPVDEPMVPPRRGTSVGTDPQQPPTPLDMDPQSRVARLVQAVVNSASNDADLRLEFNVPNVMSINWPVHVMTAAVQPPGQTAGADGTGTAAPAAAAAAGTAPAAAAAATAPGATGAAAASSSTGTRGGEHRANTLPTTATQTRSTARPQIQIGGNNNWAGLIAPTHTAFDRFLPCNSHHIREPEMLIPSNNNNNNNTNTSSNQRAAPQAAVNATTSGGTGTVNATVAAAANATATAAAAAAAAGAAASAERAAASSTAATVASAAAADAAAAAFEAVRAAARAAARAETVTAVRAFGVSGDNSAGARTLPGTGRCGITATSNLRDQLVSFLQNCVFEGAPICGANTPAAIERALDWFGDGLLYLPQYERDGYNSRDSVCNALRRSLRQVIEMLKADSCCAHNFEEQLKEVCHKVRERLFGVLILCLGKANAELYWRQIMRFLGVSLSSNFRDEAFLQFLRFCIDPATPETPDLTDAQQFVVWRNAQTTLSTEATDPSAPQQPLDAEDVEMAEVASGSGSAPVVEPPLPTVDVGSEPFHNNFSHLWLPVITRDLQTQSEETRPQPPYSDAYISGMSAKRRKIIQSEKPPSNVECLIASGVRRALQTHGLGGPNTNGANPVVNPETVISAISHDAVVQSSYSEAVRTNARERLKQDIDYKPSKYPQIAKFTEQK